MKKNSIHISPFTNRSVSQLSNRLTRLAAGMYYIAILKQQIGNNDNKNIVYLPIFMWMMKPNNRLSSIKSVKNLVLCVCVSGSTLKQKK